MLVFVCFVLGFYFFLFIFFFYNEAGLNYNVFNVIIVQINCAKLQFSSVTLLLLPLKICLESESDGLLD